MKDKKIFNILVCPVCKKPLSNGDDPTQLICTVDRLVFPIQNGIPVLLSSEASPWQGPNP